VFEAAVDGSPPVVLVGEDSETVRALLSLELAGAGYTVLEAENGQQVLDATATREVDVVLLDVEMPVLDGWATLAALKADPATAEVPVVFLTGRTDSADLVRALEQGAHDYVRKPPEPTELLARVRSATRVKALQDALRRQSAELDRLSRTDALTGLHNRRHVEEQLRSQESSARRHGYPLSVLVVDVDHFKLVKDEQGHAAGDDVLRAVAHTLRATARFEDVVGRWGGEEFVVLAPYTDVSAGAALGERLRTAVAARTGVTVSIGGAAAVTPTVADLLASADANLYAAKDAGRNRVVVTPPLV
jgi:diguanylate cyclase (GGDEF)-like protein